MSSQGVTCLNQQLYSCEGCLHREFTLSVVEWGPFVARTQVSGGKNYWGQSRAIPPLFLALSANTTFTEMRLGEVGRLR